MRKTKKQPKKKPITAAEMARLRWKDVSKEERSRLMKNVVNVRERKREEKKAKELENTTTEAA